MGVPFLEESPTSLAEFTLLYLPCVIFVIGYIMSIYNLLLNNRYRRAYGIQCLVSCVLGSQAYQLWTCLRSLSQNVICFFFNESWFVLEYLLLFGLSSIPLLGLLAKSHRQREYHISWRSRGPRTELGNMSYYLIRPPNELMAKPGQPAGILDWKKARSQNELRRDRLEFDQRHPRSA